MFATPLTGNQMFVLTSEGCYYSSLCIYVIANPKHLEIMTQEPQNHGMGSKKQTKKKRSEVLVPPELGKFCHPFFFFST